MSEPLRDFRGKLTPLADDVLYAVSHSTGQEKQELVRRIVHEWALAKLAEARMISRMVPNAKGLAGEPEGIEE